MAQLDPFRALGLAALLTGCEPAADRQPGAQALAQATAGLCGRVHEDGHTGDARWVRVDEQGRVVREDVDAHGDGRIDRTRHTRRGTAHGWDWVRVDEDLDADGTTDQWTVRVWDERGHLLSQIEDDDADDVADREIRATYDGQGRELSWTDDLDGDGVIDRRRQSTWGEWGLNEVLVDHDNDPSWDLRVRRSWDDAGQPLEETRDVDADDSIDSRRIWSWADGQATVRVDHDLDGTMDAVLRVDHAERLLELREDDDDDGRVDYVLAYARDADGRVLAEREDVDANGIDDWVATWTYDEDGRLVRHDLDVNGDSIVDRDITWTRDGQGRPVERVQRGLSPGQPDALERWHWQGDVLLGRTLDVGRDGRVDSWSRGVLRGDRLVLHQDDRDVTDDVIDATVRYVHDGCVPGVDWVQGPEWSG